MENKYLKYALIAGAIFVWGAIIVRVVGGMSGPSLPVPQPVRQQIAAVQIAADSFVLYADYPDPFLPEPDSVDDIELKKTNAGAYPAVPPPVIAAPAIATPPALKSFIQYVGIIANPEKKLQIVILSINGKEVLLRQKERKEGVLVKKISRDKVSIEYKGRQADIEKNE